MDQNGTGSMAKKVWMAGKITLIAIAALVAFVSGAWGTLALWYQLPGGTVSRTAGSTAWAIVVIALVTLAISRRSWLPLAAYALIYASLLLWWTNIVPSNQRLWTDDVSRLLSGTVNGNMVTLNNVRDFTWRTDDDYDARWETRHYDLDQLKSADAVLSYWGSRAIAHAMISFGFTDGSHVVFSVEIRKRRGERYSTLGGFFKQFESILVAADERDIIRVRTNVRGEDDYLYPLQLSQPVLRSLFLSYVRQADALQSTPAFYNTITSNCTTMVYRMARHIDPGLPHDVRLLLTGYLPSYLYKVGVVDRSVSLDELTRRGRITDRAKSSATNDNFSRAIRERLQ